MTESLYKRKVEGKYVYRYVCVLILTLIATLLFFGVWFRFVLVNNQTGHLTGRGNLLMATFIFAGLYLFVGKSLSTFKIGVDRTASLIASEVLTVFTVDFLEIFISMAITGQFRFFTEFLWRYIVLFFAHSFILGIVTVPMIIIYRNVYPPLRIYELYGDYTNDLNLKVQARKDKYHIVESKKIEDDFDEEEFKKEIKKYDAVLINDLHSELKNRILKICFDVNKRVYFTPKISDIIVKSSEELNLFDTPLCLCRNMGFSKVSLTVKRFMDILLSLIALVVLSPVMLVTAICIKIEDGGPVFYKQERCTVGGNNFWILKFRSMIVDAEKDGRPHPAGEKDDRITKVGHVIRACRVDELPQLINILKGDMSLVGPRPERIEHVKKYTEDIPEFTYRLKVKGGLTGYAQVYGKYNTTALDKLKLDLYYIMNYSILLDLQIIFETVKILFQKESTEGFSEERTNEMQGNNAV